ncbi:MAG TPA: cytochrome B [Phycisphaerales bacterium]|nr:cytochrome B [Phycisphaerales bacterium]
MKQSVATSPETVRVWDFLVRVFHWALVTFFVTAYFTGDELDAVHEFAGYAVLGLVGFRLVWGLVGTRYARFTSFWFRPREVVDYLKSLASRHPRHYLGHNPAGAWMIFALLASLLLTAATGILTEEANHGWEDLHEFFANLTLLLVLGHVAGVLVSSVLHRENLVRAMLTGRKRASLD